MCIRDRWKKRDHSGEAPVVSSAPDKGSDPGKVNSNAPGKDSGQDKDSVPGGWMARVAAGQA